ncbi:hypothetical protein JNUCC1_00630 [Lentibacillus sp. JNUCC-1]|uniref:type IV pilus biogenesis protein PilM n=1 Tax=Lentibacillus sp. JNUCC-1 TaxID=2654513 RepID=UPI0013274E0A|nr:pilus assembly protein PilM [Lentibacillus sp. JNUCC-1]MUV36826.1 hypothetical protein [Lentibacillus sp. JNUCC-1]
MVVTNRVIRYAFHKNHTPDSIVVHGERELPEGTMHDGKIADPKAFENTVQQLVQEHRWKRKDLAFCLVDDTVVIRDLDVPATLSKEEAVGYVRTQIGNSFYLPFNDPALAIDLLDSEEGTTKVRVYAYPKDKINTYKKAFSDAGLQPVIADLTSLSVYRYFYQTAENPAEHVLLIHWNRDALMLTAFKHHKAVFSRYMKIAADEEMTAEQADQIINEYIIEINRITDFYQYSITKGVHRVEQLVVSGDFSFLPVVKQKLAERLTLPIHDFPETELSDAYIDVIGLGLKNGS